MKKANSEKSWMWTHLQWTSVGPQEKRMDISLVRVAAGDFGLGPEQRNKGVDPEACGWLDRWRFIC